MANRIEMHGQIKAFYSIVFNNNYDIRTTHVSLYMFLLNQNNRNNWVEWFKCPYDLAMQGACISSRTTYYAILHDLSEFKLIEYKKGINNFKAPMIKIIPLTLPKFEQLTEQVTVPLSEQQTVPLPVPQTVPQTVPIPVPIYKLITDNLKPITDNYAIFEKFVLDLGKKNKKEFIPPTQIEVENYFTENGYSKESAVNAFKYYDVSGWVDSRGAKVRNWKQKMLSVWFKEENRITKEQAKIDREEWVRQQGKGVTYEQMERKPQ